MSFLSLLVEGKLDETVGYRIVEYAGGTVATVYGRKGANYIRQRIAGFNQLASGTPILTLVDLMDTGESCAVDVVEKWLPNRNENMIFRLVEREIESWIMADRTNMARFLKVPKNRIPINPEQVVDPKRTVINLARLSSSERLRRLLVPPEGAAGVEGPGYTSELQNFVLGKWDIREAIKGAPSLKRCVLAVSTFMERHR